MFFTSVRAARVPEINGVSPDRLGIERESRMDGDSMIDGFNGIYTRAGINCFPEKKREEEG